MHELRSRSRPRRRRRRRWVGVGRCAARRVLRGRRGRGRQSGRRGACPRVARERPPAEPATPLHLAVNRAPNDRYRREEIRAEIVRTVRTDVDHLDADRSQRRTRPRGTARWWPAGRSTAPWSSSRSRSHRRRSARRRRRGDDHRRLRRDPARRPRPDRAAPAPARRRSRGGPVRGRIARSTSTSGSRCSARRSRSSIPPRCATACCARSPTSAR